MSARVRVRLYTRSNPVLGLEMEEQAMGGERQRGSDAAVG
jgi:hypothetical protein